MSPTLVLGLAGLALWDSMSVGTLYVPAWMMLLPRFRAGRVVAYLVTMAVFYCAVGFGLLLGADAVVSAIQVGDVTSHPAFAWALIILGLAVCAFGLRVHFRTASAWEARLQQPISPVVLALIAASVELFSMLPFFGAVALLAASSLGWPMRAGLLVAYCLLMVAPAAVLLALRTRAADKVQPVLDWFSGQLAALGGGARWPVAIGGLLLAGFGASRLFGFQI